jgi:hypothetical protein
MIEKLWSAVGPIALTDAGNSRGLVTVASTAGFKVKMAVTISDGISAQLLEVKRVVNSTQMFLGEKGDIKLRSDLSSFLAGSTILALEQPRNSIPLQEIERAVYEEEPSVAYRTISVDQFGNYYNDANPLPVSFSSSIDSVQLLDKPFDSGTETNPTPIQQIFTTYTGGLSGSPVQRVTLNFVDSTRENLVNWQREYWNGSGWIVG